MILFGGNEFVSQKYRRQQHPMLLLAIRIQNADYTWESVFDIFSNEKVVYQKSIAASNTRCCCWQ